MGSTTGLTSGRRKCKAARSKRKSATPTIARSADRKSTRLNSSHANISYAVFCLKKKKIRKNRQINNRTQLHSHINSICLSLVGSRRVNPRRSHTMYVAVRYIQSAASHLSTVSYD